MGLNHDPGIGSTICCQIGNTDGLPWPTVGMHCSVLIVQSVAYLRPTSGLPVTDCSPATVNAPGLVGPPVAYLRLTIGLPATYHRLTSGLPSAYPSLPYGLPWLTYGLPKFSHGLVTLKILVPVKLLG
jgi:hypothetical protein